LNANNGGKSDSPFQFLAFHFFLDKKRNKKPPKDKFRELTGLLPLINRLLIFKGVSIGVLWTFGQQIN
jgi:hypothetical protein